MEKKELEQLEKELSKLKEENEFLKQQILFFNEVEKLENKSYFRFRLLEVLELIHESLEKIENKIEKK
ncbi:MAG: hypothetical protein KatS3mg096_700 [Candidatus Parcubacteria bacterium]|nr:MAG: hypothetical protein KatS3mg096_673 [Candidatus Parcubacteria bacterium]GIW67832.1 MAG: hypothetical protein KatS3mg096_700 [Candidatus Parcubacteria bacterium]